MTQTSKRPSATKMLQLPPVRPTFLSLPADRLLTARLGAASGCPVLPISSHVFPDGESCFRLSAPAITGDAALVATLRDPEHKLAELLLLAEAARQWGGISVGLVAPYLPFMRQDAVMQEGEAVTARSFAKIVSRSFDWLVTVDPHLHRIQRLSEIYDIPTRVVHTAPLLGQWIAKNVDHPFIVGPDVESRQWADDIAAAARAPAVVLTKTRRGDAQVSIQLPDDLDEFQGRVPVLVDDIISTGTTMAATVSQLLDRGFPAPLCVAVHAVFSPGAVDAIEAAGARCVVSTNTIPHITNRVDVTPLLASAVSRHTRRIAALR
jgi:ribose-phosphate pyrophosphokinase